MKINNKELDINELTKDVYNDKSMIKMRGNGIYLSDNQIEVLNEEVDVDDLEDVSAKLSELNYYNNTEK